MSQEAKDSSRSDNDSRAQGKQNRKQQAQRKARCGKSICLPRPNPPNEEFSNPPTCKADVGKKPVEQDYREQGWVGPQVAVKQGPAGSCYDADDDACKYPCAANDQIEGNSSSFPPADCVPSSGNRNIAPIEAWGPQLSEWSVQISAWL